MKILLGQFIVLIVAKVFAVSEIKAQEIRPFPSTPLRINQKSVQGTDLLLIRSLSGVEGGLGYYAITFGTINIIRVVCLVVGYKCYKSTSTISKEWSETLFKRTSWS